MNIRKILGLKKTDGEVGLEIEVEGNNLNINREDYWKGVQDYSLRGNSLEYVLRKPVPRFKVTSTLASLKRQWVKQGAQLKETERAGVHVHINMQEENLMTLANFIVLYYTFESVLLKFCGKSREGNLFCLRLKDAENVMDHLLHCIEMCSLASLNTNEVRYASLNFKALPHYGSLEFRGMRSTSNLKDIKTWVSLLLALKDAAKKYSHPSEIATALSAEGVESFMYSVFGSQANVLRTEGYEDLIFEDMQLSQEIAFSPAWRRYTEVLEAREKEVVPASAINW